MVHLSSSLYIRLVACPILRMTDVNLYKVTFTSALHGEGLQATRIQLQHVRLLFSDWVYQANHGSQDALATQLGEVRA